MIVPVTSNVRFFNRAWEPSSVALASVITLLRGSPIFAAIGRTGLAIEFRPLSTAEQKPATRRRKSVPLWLGEELVPEVHGRAPRAARRAFQVG